jgi:hypothetical protein
MNWAIPLWSKSSLIVRVRAQRDQAPPTLSNLKTAKSAWIASAAGATDDVLLLPCANPGRSKNATLE